MARSLQSQRQREEKRLREEAYCREMRKWLYAALPHEVEMYREVASLPQIYVRKRALPDMRPGACHENCAEFCQLYPAHRPVHGWYFNGKGLALVHTVVQHRETLLSACITPPAVDVDGFWFRPDPDLNVPYFHEGVPIPEPCPVISRKGTPTGIGVREDPEAYVAFVKSELRRTSR